MSIDEFEDCIKSNSSIPLLRSYDVMEVPTERELFIHRERQSFIFGMPYEEIAAHIERQEAKAQPDCTQPTVQDRQ